MEKCVYSRVQQVGVAAGTAAAKAIKEAIETKAEANIVLATGTSQFETLQNLVQAQGIDWRKVTLFHLDEYIGLQPEHPASFRKFLKERFLDKLPPLKAVHFVNGNAADPHQECQRLEDIIAGIAVDVALVGIGENGHLAFNDPPADFEVQHAYIVVDMDRQDRQ